MSTDMDLPTLPLRFDLVTRGDKQVPVWNRDDMLAAYDLGKRAAIAERDALRAQVEALWADAERYRWLRGGPDVPTESIRWARWEVRHWCGRWWNTLFAEQLDAAIDVAREGSGNG